jgi:hypothetical protein
MNKNLKMLSASLCAAALVTLLGACATTESNTSQNSASTSASASSGAKFCHKERYYVTRNEMVCNWATSAADACRDNLPSSRIAQTAVTSEPTNASRCDNGQWLIQVTMKNVAKPV